MVESVSAAYARGLLELATARGADRAALVAAAGLDAARLADPDARLPFAGYAALMRRAIGLTGDPALALHYGEDTDIGQVSIVGLIGQAAATMAEAREQLNRYVRLVVDVDTDGPERFRLDADAEGLWMTDTRRNPNAFPQLTESAFAQLVCGPRQLGLPPFVRAVQVTHDAPAYAAEYERVFDAPVTFGARRNAMLLDAAILGQPVARLPRYAFGVLTRHADAMLESLQHSPTTRSRVEALLLPRLHTGAVGMDSVAAQLGVSRQTLYRRLQAEGVTFAEVLDELRRNMALDYLTARKVSVHETAYLVGFSEPSAFSRAFKRWTGKRPRDAS